MDYDTFGSPVNFAQDLNDYFEGIANYLYLAILLLLLLNYFYSKLAQDLNDYFEGIANYLYPAILLLLLLNYFYSKLAQDLNDYFEGIANYLYPAILRLIFTGSGSNKKAGEHLLKTFHCVSRELVCVRARVCARVCACV